MAAPRTAIVSTTRYNRSVVKGVYVRTASRRKRQVDRPMYRLSVGNEEARSIFAEAGDLSAWSRHQKIWHDTKRAKRLAI